MKATVEIPDGAIQVQASPPALVSQRTAEHHLGIGRRQFLELVQRFRAAGGDVIRCGRTRLVEPKAFIAWLRNREAVMKNNPAEAAEAAELAAAAGLRLAK